MQGISTSMIKAFVKYKFFDFIVNEIYQNEVVQYQSPPQPSQEYDNAVKFLENPSKCNAEFDVSAIQRIVQLEEKTFGELKDYIQKQPQNSSFAFKLPPDCTKLQRTALHSLFKQLQNPLLETKTIENNQMLIQIHSKFKFPENPVHSRFQNFVMLKQNTDTLSAVQWISQCMRHQKIQVDKFSMCGIKDQRGVTTQIIQIPGYVFPQALTENLPNCIRLGDFQQTAEQLKMGGHDGNQFVVVLRALGLQPTQAIPNFQELSQNLKRVAKQGLINNFGHQRFGCSVVNTDIQGQFLAQGRFRLFLKAVIVNDYFLKFEDLNGEKQQIESYFQAMDSKSELRDEEYMGKVLQQMSEKVKCEQKPRQLFDILLKIQKPINDLTDEEVVGTLSNMSTNQKTFYFHAFQSRMFNDLCMQYQDRFQLQINDLVMDQDRNVFTIDESNINDFQLSDLCLPLIGFDTMNQLPSACREYYQQILQNYNVTSLSKKFRGIFSPGTFRKVFIIPKNVQFCFATHVSIDEQLVSTPFEPIDDSQIQFVDADQIDLYKEYSCCNKYISIVLKFSLEGSAYATEVIKEVLGGGGIEKELENDEKACEKENEQEV